MWLNNKLPKTICIYSYRIEIECYIQSGVMTLTIFPPIVTTLTIMFVVDDVNAIYFMHESTIGFSFAKHIHRYITETYYNKMFGCCMY